MTVPEASYPLDDREPAWNLLERTLSAMWALTARQVREDLELREIPQVLRNYAESVHDALSPSTIDPYSNPTVLLAELGELERGGWLEEIGDGRYRVSGRALRNVGEALEAADRRLEALEVLSPVELEEVASALSRLAGAGHVGAEAAGAPIEGERSPIGRIRRSIMALSARRDAAHRAAWSPLGISGEAWNAFTLIWRGDARNAVEVAALQSWRGYPVEDYEAAVISLVQQGWLEPDRMTGRYRPTGAGEVLRDEAEARTDRQFYQAWSILDVTERGVLAGRLSTLAEKLREVRRAEREASRQSTTSI